MSTNLILAHTQNRVRTLTMNNPRRLNGWTLEMMEALFEAMKVAAADDNVAVLVLTGTGDYYSAGVNLSSTIQLGHPKALREQIRSHNQQLFDQFIDFPKPILVAFNGPAIGATVTSSTLCDGAIASENANFLTPFARLGVPPEGCSSEHLPRLIGEAAAERMLGREGWKPTAAEALEMNFLDEVVAPQDLANRAQAIAESWIEAGHTRSFRAGATAEQLKAINARESEDLADAFLAPPFLMGQFKFLWSRKKYGPALTFLGLRATRPGWSRLL
ncbi:MAG: enoyl-CoA hydratase/isomerase family protein [Bradymonadia bacterium]